MCQWEFGDVCAVGVYWCACVCACVRACVRVCMYDRERVSVNLHACVHACLIEREIV